MRVRSRLPWLVLLWCITGAWACPEPEAAVEVEGDRPEQPAVCDAEGNLVQKTSLQRPGCSYRRSFGPGKDREHSCTFRGEQPVCGPYWRNGDPTPAGPYQCTCNIPRSRSDAERTSVVDIADASDCDAALDAACTPDRQAPPPCSVDDTGMCWPVEGGEPGRWSCQCQGSEELHEVSQDTCTTAVFLACAAPCSDAFGRCEPDRESLGYHCECPDGEQVYWPGARACSYRLARCRPTGECQTSLGRCAPRPGGYGCFCPNLAAGQPGSRGNPILVPDADAYGNCQMARELACGVPAAGVSCSGEELGRTHSCAADGSGGWDCTCSTGFQQHVGQLLTPRLDLPPEIATRVFTCEEALPWCW